jgi:hypothetical protein
VPSAEQADNRRRGRVEDRIRQIAQDRLGLLTFTVSNKALDSLACKTGSATSCRPLIAASLSGSSRDFARTPSLAIRGHGPSLRGQGVELVRAPGLKCRRSLSYARQVESDKRLLPAVVHGPVAQRASTSAGTSEVCLFITSTGLNLAHPLLSLTSDFR